MLKKVAIIIIILVYGLSSTGAILHLDYCCGKLLSISLSPAVSKKGHCNQDRIKAKSCCDSKQVHLSVKGEQEPLQKAANFASISILFQPINQFDLYTQPSARLDASDAGPPLFYSSTPLFIHHRVIRV